jgi:DNA-binding Lrp family transcriptional regulator
MVRPVEIDDIDKKLLNIIQWEFPLIREPFSLLALNLDIPAKKVITRIERLKTAEIIRLIGPVLNPNSLGYRTTLAVARIHPQKLNLAGRVISRHPGVSHCYQRDHDFNLWFTLTVPVSADLEDEVRKIGKQIGSTAILNLPAIKMFKIGAYFTIGEGDSTLSCRASRDNHVASNANNKKLSVIERAVINALQQDLPLIEKPFDNISGKLAIEPDIFLWYCRSLLRRGIMRRFSASVNHTRLGYAANAMVCWNVPAHMVDSAGSKVASFPEVSHCYERQTSTKWPYNLFAMVHADKKENCRAVIDKICIEAALDRSAIVLLFSTAEMKKTRIVYKV